MKKNPGLVFLIIGFAFIVIGISGQGAFIVIGAAMLVLGLVFMARARRQARSE